MRLQAHSTAVVAVDMHRGHLDRSVATLPLAAERCGPVIAQAAKLFHELRAIGVRIIHVVTGYRESGEIAANPFWKAIHDDPTKAKKGYSAFYATDLEFVLRRIGIDTVILAGINTTTCVLCTAFEATNRDFRVVIASDAVDSMDGEEMHRFALRLMAASIGWPLTNQQIMEAFKSSL